MVKSQEEELRFSGLLPDVQKEEDYVAGENSPLTAADVNPSGNWNGYKVSYERQLRPGVFDTYNCTGFATTNAVEIWLQFYKENGLLPKTHLDFLERGGYYDSTGAFDTSERALGSLAGTNENGNYAVTVIQTARTFGLCANKTWAWDNTQQLSFPSYYARPNQAALDQMEEWKKYFDISYERFYIDPANCKARLKKSPLVVGLYTCPGWNTNNPIPWCGVTNTNHLVVGTEYELQNRGPMILDSYPEWYKQLALNYQIPFAVNIYLTIKDVKGDAMNLVNDNGTIYLVGEKGKVGIASPEALAMFNKLTNEITSGSTAAVPDLGVADVMLGFDFKKDA
jgi:hypothetical protein